MAISSSKSKPEWFDINRYVDTRLLDFTGWKTQIGTRCHLTACVVNKDFDSFDRFFPLIQEFPFYELDVNLCPSNSLSVYSTRLSFVKALANRLSDVELSDALPCDQILQSLDIEDFGNSRLLTLDISLPKTQIQADFNSWLTQEKEKTKQNQAGRLMTTPLSEKNLSRWANLQLLAYQDLKMWHMRQSIPMPSDDTIADWIYTTEYGGSKSDAEQARIYAKQVFSLQMIKRLNLAIGREEIA